MPWSKPAVALLLVVSPLAGCVGGEEPSELPEAGAELASFCGPQLSFVHEGAFDDVQQALRGDFVVGSAERAPKGGLPFDWSPPSEGQAELRGVEATPSWNETSLDPVFRLAVSTASTGASVVLTGEIMDDVPDAEVKALFEAFAANVSDLSEEDIEERADTFLEREQWSGVTHRGDERVNVTRYQIPFEEDLATAELFDALAPEASPQEEGPSLSSSVLFETDAWSFWVQVEQVRVQVHDGERLVEVRADAMDRLWVELDMDADTADDEKRSVVTSVFDDLGLGEPGTDRWAFTDGCQGVTIEKSRS